MSVLAKLRCTGRRAAVWAVAGSLAFLGGVVAPSVSHAAVRSCSSSTPVASRPVLAYGDKGSCVRLAQQLLLGKGYSLGGYSATGNYLTHTRAAVQRFQKAKGLTVNGKVDTRTWRALAAGSSSSSSSTGSTYSIYRGPNTSNRAILTFDDCPKSLDAFKATVKGAKDLGVSLALFPTGQCLKSGRFDAEYARTNGHYVFNHSVSHPNLTDLSYEGVRKELSAPGVVTTYGRPPYGAHNTTVRKAYASKNMKIWLWNVDTNDWKGKTTSELVSYVVTNTKAGNTVLMHMQWNGFNTSAIKRMRDGLANKGVSLCRNQGATTTAPAEVKC